MAAAQLLRATALTDEEKAKFEELKEAASCKIALEAKVDVKKQAVTHGYIFNGLKDHAKLQMIDQHNWSGSSVQPYPQVIPYHREPAEFEHRGLLPPGSKGAVLYADGANSTARKWLVAFDNPSKKVYVEAGPTGPVNWDVIEVKLDASESTSRFEDTVLGGKALAVNYGQILMVSFSN
ncbi:hypothetical protein BVRB_3g054040 [Beta vulgaris subsp. vulgaris]|uniref:jasmonate-induced protein homolog n=1 Tax=Beta vulgaris subsp. vulgaris TaxID=3555 RepID=UPI0005401250|nr:jasmonate-induced protein homolog [Beta vulgaris subsp. vulgaris]XP_010671706.1 jasmonate-induced protein homolog [Beta vulgaris subsp. vulgaris]KMT16250.1 hypothetical protein BVRB_3g054040 [Beta vulgaris subsp. vulgaris]